MQANILRVLVLIPILCTVHQWLPLLGPIPMPVVAAPPPLTLVNNTQSRQSMEDSVAGVFRPSYPLDARDDLDNTQYNEL